MLLPLLALGTIAAFVLAYRFYGRFVAARFGLDDARPTPACTVNDGVDYTPTPRPLLLAQHFAAIAAAGPIVGPITAGLWFGWGPALAWILLGCIFIGACHDFSSLVASVRHGARSVTEVVREQMGPRAFACFLAFIWLSLIYVIIAFTDLTAMQFIQRGPDPNGELAEMGAGVASSSILYLLLAAGLGIAMTKGGLSLRGATILGVPLLLLVIWGGQLIPTTFGPETVLFGQRLSVVTAAAPGAGGFRAASLWGALILLYCGIASVLPMWALLQPRGYLGGYFLYITLGAGFLGMLCFPNEVHLDPYKGWTGPAGQPLFPILFVTIACGACSGFHGLVCSGTTSKQIARESHTPTVGYGGMLLEGFVAVMALATVMIFVPDASPGAKPVAPPVIYAAGIGTFLNEVTCGVVSKAWGTAFGMMAFGTFVFDTLDVATRLGRYILEELFGWKTAAGRFGATVLTLALPLAYVLGAPAIVTLGGRTMPAWQAVWTVFGSSNQLLAGLTLLGVTVWLIRARRPAWVTGIPMFFMIGMTGWALGYQAWQWGSTLGEKGWVLTVDALNGGVAVVLLVLAAILAVEALRSVRNAAASVPAA
ncbi:MAG: carbon starvation protein A [Planctomycetes bacterium]|nr:carbon starvation protein A [Planctomycetota bacterium]